MADDLVQEGMVTLLEVCRVYQGKPFAELVKITKASIRNKHTDLARKRRRRTPVGEVDPFTEDPKPQPVLMAQFRELARAVEQAAKTRSEQAIVAVMKTGANTPHQVAKAASIPLRAAKVKIDIIRERLGA